MHLELSDYFCSLKAYSPHSGAFGHIVQMPNKDAHENIPSPWH